MKKRSGRWIWWALCILWLALIFGHSLMPAELSKAESNGLLARLSAAFPILTDRLLRKLAHFTEFFVFGALLGQCLPGRLGLPVFVSLVCALCDETIQLFVPGRSGQVRDVWIDFAGALAAILLTLLVRWIILQFRPAGPAPDAEPQTGIPQ